jgi:hypothetical protein
MVAAKEVEKIILGYSAKAAENDRPRRVGPFFLNGARPYYLVSDLIEYFTRNPVPTTDGN